jgi:hypothetical protein
MFFVCTPRTLYLEVAATLLLQLCLLVLVLLLLRQGIPEVLKLLGSQRVSRSGKELLDLNDRVLPRAVWLLHITS